MLKEIFMFLVLFSLNLKKKAVICSYNRWLRVLIPKLPLRISSTVEFRFHLPLSPQLEAEA